MILLPVNNAGEEEVEEKPVLSNYIPPVSEPKVEDEVLEEDLADEE